MLSLNTNLSLETIKKSENLRDYFFAGYDTKTGKDLDIEITIADIIDNAESLFEDDYKSHCHLLVLSCCNDEPLKEIEIYILSNLK